MSIELLDPTEVIDRAEISGSTVLVEYSKTEAMLAELRKKHAGVVFDLTTTKGDKEARAARLELVKLRTSLEAKRVEFKAPALAFGKKIDTEAKRITDEIRVLELFIDKQITADEDRRAVEKAERDRIEALRIQGLRDKIAGIRSCLGKCRGITAERIANGIEQVGRIDVSEAVFFELAGEALSAKTETIAEMRILHTEAVAREAELAKIEEQRIENERIAAQNKAQADAMAAQQAALDKAAADLKIEQQRVADELKRIEDDKAAAKELADAEAKRASDARLKEQAAQFEALEQSETKRLSSLNSAMVVDVCEQVTPCLPAHTQISVYSEKAWSEPVVICPPTPPSMKLGQICERLGFNVTAEFLRQLGFEPAATEKAAKLYHERDFSSMCDALVHHVKNVQFAAALKTST